MDKTLLFKIPYGVYLVTSENSNEMAGCIINTTIQITDEPSHLVMSINKNSHTAQTIVKSKKCIIGMLSENCDLNIIEHFGNISGNIENKFKSDYLKDISYDMKDNIIYFKKDFVCNLICTVKEIIDCDSHYLFVLNLIETIAINKEDKLMTYEMYRNLKTKNKDTYICRICHYVYDGNISFTQLPDDYICPICGKGKDFFEKI
ncbi:MAG: flavin reductase [Clostridia bacterium]